MYNDVVSGFLLEWINLKNSLLLEWINLKNSVVISNWYGMLGIAYFEIKSVNTKYNISLDADLMRCSEFVYEERPHVIGPGAVLYTKH